MNILSHKILNLYYSHRFAWHFLPIEQQGRTQYSIVCMQDWRLSDSMDPIMATMRLNPFVRKAVGTARGVRIRMNMQEFEMSVLSILGFKVRPCTVLLTCHVVPPLLGVVPMSHMLDLPV